MRSLICLFLCLSLFQNFVDSGLLLDKITSSVSNVNQGVTCGLHKVGSILNTHEHSNDPCDRNKQDTNTINQGNNENDGNQQSNKQEGSKTETSTPKIDIRNEKQTANGNSSTTPTPEDRRLIQVGSNCPEGYRGDGRGNCREEY